ncbi:MAG: tetratricopeptide repeat protein [Pyrinomonadaceae bacterium]|nr:tetratricopeptide repeat protein [Pyrinomonadaceae bacterium]
MLRKNYLTTLLAVVLFLTGVIAVSAQTAPVRGKVELKKADGTFEPVVGAAVDVYRTDIKGKLPSGKTDKKGEFAFAGMPLGATFAFSVSAPNIKPEVFPNIKAGNEKVNITVVAGDGKRLTEEEARQALAAVVPTPTQDGKPAQLTAEQKKAQAEYEKQVAEINAKNARSQNNDALIKKALEEGNKAFGDKNYEVAVAKYDEGINAEPDYAGSAPILLNNKTVVLLARATINYNQTVKGDAAAKTAGMTSVKKDLDDAVTASERSLTVLKTAIASDAAVQKNYDAAKFQAAANRKEAYRLMAKTGVDRNKGKESIVAFEEYMTLETDAKKKADAQLALGDVLRENGDADNAVIAYRKALEMSPDNPDVLAGLGLSLFNAGVVSDNTAVKQEGLNFMQKFADTAPEAHPLKASVKDAVDYLKTQDKLTPQKVTKGAVKKKS